MTTSEVFLVALLIIFAVPWLIWRLGRTDYFAPLVVVQIVTGIILAVKPWKTGGVVLQRTRS